MKPLKMLTSQYIKYKKITKTMRYLIISLITVTFISCTSEKNEADQHAHEEHDDEAHAHEEANEQMVELNQAQIKKADIQMGQFKSMDLNSTVKTTGRLELPPQNEANVSAIMSGMVSSIEVLPGEFVKEQQTLAYLKDPQFSKLQQAYLESTSKLEYVEEEYKRNKELFEEDVGSKKEFQQIRSEYKSLKAKVQSLASQLRLININPKQLTENTVKDRIAIKAPIEGYIKNINIKMGQYVESNETLFELVDNHHIHIDLMVYEKDVPKVSKGQKILFTLAKQKQAEPLQAEIFALGKALEKDLKAVRMHAELKHDYPNLLPGMYIEGRIVTDTLSGHVLREGGVVKEEDHHYIFYTKDDGNQDHIEFMRQEVETGPTNAGYTQVKNPEIPENAKFVTNNAHYLLREMQEGASSGHGH